MISSFKENEKIDSTFIDFVSQDFDNFHWAYWKEGVLRETEKYHKTWYPHIWDFYLQHC